VQSDFSQLVDPKRARDHAVLAVLINKGDLEDTSDACEHARQFAAERKLLFFRVSARTGEGISEAFESIAGTALRHYSTDEFLDCLIVGDRQVGKTNLVSRFFRESFCDEYEPTKRFRRRCEDISLGERSLVLQIRGASEMEELELLRGQHDQPGVIIVVYDVTDPVTFAHVQAWLRAIHQLPEVTGSGVCTFVVGNKTDLTAEPTAISSTKRKSAAATHLQFFNVSAKTGSNIAEFRQAVIETFHKPGIDAKAPSGKPRKK
jgi:GTPase SAR1 family protein